jgi:hypothetical protein
LKRFDNIALPYLASLYTATTKTVRYSLLPAEREPLVACESSSLAAMREDDPAATSKGAEVLIPTAWPPDVRNTLLLHGQTSSWDPNRDDDEALPDEVAIPGTFSSFDSEEALPDEVAIPGIFDPSYVVEWW